MRKKHYSFDEKEEFQKMVGKPCIVNSYRVKDKTGIITSYIREPNHFWVKLNELYKTMSGKMSYFHKCNAGNVKIKRN